MSVLIRRFALPAAAAMMLATEAQAQMLYARSDSEYSALTGLADPIWDSAQYTDQFSSAEFPYISTGTRHSGSVTFGGGSTSAGNAVGVGYIRSFADVDGFMYNQGGLYSESWAWFEDELVFSSNTLPVGTPGVAVLQISITHAQGTISGGPITRGAESMDSYASVRVLLDGAVVASEAQETYYDSGQNNEYIVDGEIPSVLIVPVAFTVGGTRTIRVEVNNRAYIFSDGGQVQGSLFSAFGSSVRSQGFQEIPEGVTVEGSIDWTQPAPVAPDFTCPADLTGPALDGVPNGIVDAFDLNYYIALWLNNDLAADLTGAALDGTPDGAVNAFDLNYYIDLWINGQGACE